MPGSLQQGTGLVDLDILRELERSFLLMICVYVCIYVLPSMP